MHFQLLPTPTDADIAIHSPSVAHLQKLASQYALPPFNAPMSAEWRSQLSGGDVGAMDDAQVAQRLSERRAWLPMLAWTGERLSSVPATTSLLLTHRCRAWWELRMFAELERELAMNVFGDGGRVDDTPFAVRLAWAQLPAYAPSPATADANTDADAPSTRAQRISLAIERVLALQRECPQHRWLLDHVVLSLLLVSQQSSPPSTDFPPSTVTDHLQHMYSHHRPSDLSTRQLASFLSMAGRIHIYLGDLHGAQWYFHQLNDALSPDTAWHHDVLMLNRALMAWARDDLTATQTILTTLLSVNGECQVARAYLALVEVMEGRVGEATAKFREQWMRNTDGGARLPSTLYNLTTCFELLPAAQTANDRREVLKMCLSMAGQGGDEGGEWRWDECLKL